MIAFLLAGGEGTRLWPLTTVIPKPLLPLKGKPIVVWIIEHIVRTASDVDRIVLFINEEYREQFEWILRHSGTGAEIEVVGEEDPRVETAGRLLTVRTMIDGDFLLHYGDIITNLNIGDLIRAHKESQASATLAISMTERIPKGVVEVDESNRIVKLVEKPLIPCKNWCGVGVFGPEVMRYTRIGYDFPRDVIPRMLASGEKIMAYTEQDFWYLDIGSIPSYKEAAQRLGSMEPKA